MLSYARANVRINNEKQKENSLEGITWSEMGKQNIQAKDVFSTMTSRVIISTWAKSPFIKHYDKII